MDRVDRRQAIAQGESGGSSGEAAAPAQTESSDEEEDVDEEKKLERRLEKMPPTGDLRLLLDVFYEVKPHEGWAGGGRIQVRSMWLAHHAV